MITIKVEDFDTSKLPKDCQDINSPNFKPALKEYIEQDYGNSGLFVSVDIDDEFIFISQNKEPEAQLESAVQSLQQGDYKAGKQILEELFTKYPNNSVVLYNLGMIFSDEGNLNQAIELLSSATEINPEHAHAWTALAVAYMRSNNLAAAIKAANTAAQVDSDDPYVLRTVGALLAQSGNNSNAIIFLEKAVEKSPNDSISLHSLAECLRTTRTSENKKRADGLYKKVIELAPGTPQAQKAMDRRREFANEGFRKAGGGNLRPDAVMYCMEALKRFSEMTTQSIAGVAVEAATLGQSGLEVNNPDKLYSLKTLSGKYSGLNVVCILHTAIQKIAPGNDSGFDVQAEYEEALKLFNQNH